METINKTIIQGVSLFWAADFIQIFEISFIMIIY